MTVKQIEILDWRMAGILAKKTEADRLRLAWDMWRAARGMLTQLIQSEHAGRSEDDIRQEVARRLASGS
jgi:hypothetical protein